MVKTILVVHRDRDVRDRFARAVTESSYRTILAESEGVALEVLAPDQPDVHLVLLDLGVAPDPAGLVRRLRGSGQRDLPLVVFASTLDDASREASVSGKDLVPQLAALGVAGYVNDHTPSQDILPVLAPYLFPDNFNRRTGRRVALGVPVSYRAGQRIAGAITLDVGTGGLAVRTLTPLPTGTALHLKFRLPGTGTDLEAEGRVAWSDRKVGMGVRFEEIGARDQATIDAFVNTRPLENGAMGQ